MPKVPNADRHKGKLFPRASVGRLKLALCGAALSPLLLAGMAYAEDAAMVSDTAAQPVGVDEVVVTARHRSEYSQKVPAALSVIGGDFLEKTNTTSIAQLSQYVPSIQFSAINARNTIINIRGFGSNLGSANDGLTPGVGFYVDQVYYTRPGMATLDLIDIDHIEVLRGPQGTLFGKDTTAGAITVSTAAPTFEPHAQAEITGGNRGYFQAKGSVSGPLAADKLAGRLSIATTQRDGLLTNLYSGRKINNYRNFTVRGQLLYTPREDLKLRFIADYGNQFNNCCTQVLGNIVSPPNGKNYRAIAQSFGFTPVIDPFARQANVDSAVRARQETGGASLAVDYDLPNAVFTSITAWRFWNWSPKNDADFSPLPVLLDGHTRDYQNQFTQEFRIASSGDHRVDYVAGLYLYREQIKAMGLTQYGSAASAVLAGATVPSIVLNNLQINSFGNFNTDSIAGYGQVTWHLTPKLNLTGGLRYTEDFKRGDFTQVAGGTAPLAGALASFAATRAGFAVQTAYQVKNVNANISGTVNVSYQFTPEILGYVTLARGHKAGGLNLTQLPAGANAIVDPEQVNSAEAGIKTQLLDRRLTFNAAVFWQEDRDYQANLYNTSIARSYLSNIPRVRSEGLEADIRAQPTPELSLYASAIYDDAVYADYPAAPCGLEAVTQPFCKLSGRPLAGVPRWAASLGGEYSHDVALGAREAQAYVGADYSYRSSIYSHYTDSIYTRLPDLGLLNARAGLRSDGWDAYVWAKNLGDKNYLTALQPGSGNTGAIYAQLGDPRTYGVTVRLKY